MKGNSDITATAISDAALICVYLTMTLSKAALKCPPALLPQWARRVSYVFGCEKNYSRVMKGIIPNSRKRCFLHLRLRKKIFSRYKRNYAKQPQTLFLTFAVAEKMILAL